MVTVCFDGKEDNEGYKAKNHQREQIVQAKHRHKHAYDDEAVLDKVDEKVGEHHRDRARVVTDSSHQLTYRH